MLCPFLFRMSGLVTTQGIDPYLALEGTFGEFPHFSTRSSNRDWISWKMKVHIEFEEMTKIHSFLYKVVELFQKSWTKVFISGSKF